MRLGELANASVMFWAGDVDARRLPATIRVRSRDPRADFDRQFHLSWRRVPLYGFQFAEDARKEYANVSAGPFVLPTRMDSTLGDMGPIIPPSVRAESSSAGASARRE